MERGAPIFEDSDTEQEFDQSEYIPPQIEQEPSFIDRVKEILGLDKEEEEDEDNEESSKKKKKGRGLLRRFFPAVDKEDMPVDSTEQPPLPGVVERGFSLSMFGAAEPEPSSTEESPVMPNETVPEVIHPETTPEPVIDIETTNLPDDTVESTPPPPESIPEPTAENSDDGGSEEPPIPPARPPAGVPPFIAGGGGGEGDYGERRTVIQETTPPESIDTSDFATHREVNKKAGLAFAGGVVGGALLARRGSEKRDKVVVEESKQRDAVLKQELEVQKANTDTLKQQHQRLREQVEQERQRHAEQPPPPEPVKKIETQPQPPLIKRPARRPNLMEKPNPTSGHETTVNREITPRPVALEQDRRHEINHEPKTQLVNSPLTPLDNSSGYRASNQSFRHDSANNSLYANPDSQSDKPAVPLASKPLSETYKKAAISGVATAVVLLAILLVISLAR